MALAFKLERKWTGHTLKWSQPCCAETTPFISSVLLHRGSVCHCGGRRGSLVWGQTGGGVPADTPALRQRGQRSGRRHSPGLTAPELARTLTDQMCDPVFALQHALAERPAAHVKLHKSHHLIHSQSSAVARLHHKHVSRFHGRQRNSQRIVVIMGRSAGSWMVCTHWGVAGRSVQLSWQS